MIFLYQLCVLSKFCLFLSYNKLCPLYKYQCSAPSIDKGSVLHFLPLIIRIPVFEFKYKWTGRNKKEMSEWGNFGKERYYWTQDHSLRTVDGLQSADSAVTEVTHGPSASFTATTGECDKSRYNLGSFNPN
jgi:hypothetical protein